jgi:hypothetical protein
MAAMSKKTDSKEELQRIDEAIDESILNASVADLREELTDQGEDAAQVVAEIDSAIARAKLSAAKRRFDQAKIDLQAFKKKGNLVLLDKEAARTRLQMMRSSNSGNASDMMMAARKGKGPPESDEDGLLDDLAQLQALEADDPEAGQE